MRPGRETCTGSKPPRDHRNWLSLPLPVSQSQEDSVSVEEDWSPCQWAGVWLLLMGRGGEGRKGRGGEERIGEGRGERGGERRKGRGGKRE